MPVEFQFFLFIIYAVGFCACFTVFQKSHDLLEDEDNYRSESRNFSLSVILAVFWPFLLMFSIVFAVYCLWRGLLHND